METTKSLAYPTGGRAATAFCEHQVDFLIQSYFLKKVFVAPSNCGATEGSPCVGGYMKWSRLASLRQFDKVPPGLLRAIWRVIGCISRALVPPVNAERACLRALTRAGVGSHTLGVFCCAAAPVRAFDGTASGQRLTMARAPFLACNIAFL